MPIVDADPSTPDTVEVHLDTWADTLLHSAGCTWLEVSGNDRDRPTRAVPAPHSMNTHWEQPKGIKNHIPQELCCGKTVKSRCLWTKLALANHLEKIITAAPPFQVSGGLKVCDSHSFFCAR